MLPWLAAVDRRRELERIQRFYPGSCFQLPRQPGKSAILHLPMLPVPNEAERTLVFADLRENLTVGLLPSGRVCHSGVQCSTSEAGHARYLENLKFSDGLWWLTLSYPPTPGPHYSNHPQARIVSPIPLTQLLSHPHLSRSADGDVWACPIPPHATEWSWRSGGTLGYLDQLSLWLLKTQVWIATGGGIGRFGIWLGAAGSHQPTDVLSSTDPDDPCTCGRGMRYADCHRPLDLRAVLGSR